MSTDKTKQHQRIIFGLKLRHWRQQKSWNFEELSRHSGISISYLNEIEKGKKYPQAANLSKLADALGVPKEELVSTALPRMYAPLVELLQSNFLSELPLDLFGIELQQVIEIIARAPDRVNAFISALLEIARNYSLREEHFFFAALRAYQELRNNYFEEIEASAEQFIQEHQLPSSGGVTVQQLTSILDKTWGCTVQENGLDAHAANLPGIRSVYNPFTQRILLNGQLNERQKAFQLAKELGFNVLNLQHQRPLASNFVHVRSFEEALNNYKAAYFAVAILVNRHAFVDDVAGLFRQNTWSSAPLLQMMEKYNASPEVLFQRFNVMTAEFGLEKVFFQRFIHDVANDRFEMDKELHLNRKHQPHASGLGEHYCRRWLSLSLLRQLNQEQTSHQTPYLAGVQRARFVDSSDEYLCIAVAKHGHPTPGHNVCVTIGVLLDEHARRTIQFWNDPAIPHMEVNVTCQRCAIADCKERVAPPRVLEKREERKRVQGILEKLTGKPE